MKRINIINQFKLNQFQKINLAQGLDPYFIPHNHCGHSWWDEDSTSHHQVLGFNAKSQRWELMAGTKKFAFEHDCDVIDPIEREYSYSQNGDLTESDGAALYTYCNALLISRVLIFHKWKNRRNYGESITLYKEVNFSTCVTAIVKAQNDEFDAFLL